MNEIEHITKNNAIKETADKLSDVNIALSDSIEDDDSINEYCDIVTGEMETYLNTKILAHMFIAAKYIIARYDAGIYIT